MRRRQFLYLATLAPWAGRLLPSPTIWTVSGGIEPHKLGRTLIHEHVLVDCIGAAQYNPDRWQRAEVVEKVLPYLLEIKRLGFDSLIECTPAYLGRDPLLLRELSDRSGLQILTNTGYYAAANNTFLPAHAFTETAEALAARWTDEFRNGIGTTGIRPGFMKISVNAPGEKLDDTDRKIVGAAALAHLQTGLTIASHTGLAAPALEQLQLLQAEGVQPAAFVWVHAQAQALSKRNLNPYLEIGRLGAWISLDGLADDNVETYAELVTFLRDERLLHRVLLSHDAGWYKPGEAQGGEFRGYTTLSKKLLPALQKRGFRKRDFQQLLASNPMTAFTVAVRRV